MKFRRVLVAVIAASILSISLEPRIARADEAVDTVSEKLREIVLFEGEDGVPVIGEEERAHFERLPEHERRLLDDAVAGDQITSADHLRRILDVAPDVPNFALALEDNCFLCHTDPESHGDRTLFSPDSSQGDAPHLRLDQYVADVHFRSGVGCAGCHGGDASQPMDHDFPDVWPASESERSEDRRWVVEFCARCHSNPTYMRRYNPKLPTDQLQKYRTSGHGKALLEAGNSGAAQCISCHGVHGIRSSSSPLSSVAPKNVATTCGRCHADAKFMAPFRLANGTPMPTDQYADYLESVHGKALLEHGDLGAPTCNDCHGNHAAMPPEVANVSQICRTCHPNNGSLFDGSRHKQVFEAHGWPECETCHGNHAIASTSDTMLKPGPDSICTNCHDAFATGNPECSASQAYFYEEIAFLAESQAEYSRRAERLARRGLDVEPIEQELTVLYDHLKQSRSYIHAFERSEFAQAAAPGRASVVQLDELERVARADLRFRLLGLVFASLMIGATIFLLWIKLRNLEDRQR